MDVFQLMGRIAIDASEANATIDDTVSNAKSSGNSLGSIFTKVGAAVGGAFAVKKIAEFGVVCLKTAASAETAFAKVNTLLSSGTDTTAYFDSIKQASLETGVAVTDFSEAVYSAISASVDQASAVDFTTQAVKLAKGGFTDTTTAVDVLTTAINAYGLKASDATAISDKLVMTQNLGKTTVGELASAMGKVIPTAKSFNVDLDSLCGTYAVMTKNGIATAEATTYLNSMFNELGKSGTTAANVLKNKTGQSFTQLMASGYSLTDVLGILQTEAARTGQSVNDMFGSQEAGKAANTLLSNIDDLTASTETMRNSAGSTEAAYAKMSDTISEKVQKLKNRFELLMESVGEDLAPAFSSFLDSVEKIMPAIEAIASVIGTVLGGAFNVAAFAVDALATGINNVVAPSRNAANALAGTAETVDDARAKVAELEAELQRLKTTQENANKTYAETAGIATSTASSYAAAQANVGDATSDTAIKITQTTEALRMAQEQLAQLESQEQAAAEAAADPANRFQAATEQYVASATELLTQYQATYESVLSNVDGWFQPFAKASVDVKTSIQDIMSNMQSQIDFNQQYTDNINYLSENGLGTLSDALQSYGAEGAAYASTIASALQEAGGASTEEGQRIVAQFLELLAGVDQSQADLSESLTLMDGEFASEMEQIAQTYADSVKDLDKSAEALEAANNTMSSFLSGISSGSKKVITAMSDLGSKMTSALQSSLKTVYINVETRGSGAKYAVQGSFAKGLDYVPFDNYLANLHKGEAVLTAAEARTWRAGKNIGKSSTEENENGRSTGKNRGMTIIQNIQAIAQTPAELAAATEAYFTQARWAM